MEKITTTVNDRAGDPIKGAIFTIVCCASGPIIIAAVFLGVYADLLSLARSFEDFRDGLDTN